MARHYVLTCDLKWTSKDALKISDDSYLVYILYSKVYFLARFTKIVLCYSTAIETVSGMRKLKLLSAKYKNVT